MHNNIEYQLAPSHVNIWLEAFHFSHMQSIWTMFWPNNNSGKVSKYEYMESQKWMKMDIHDWLWIFNILLYGYP